MFAAEYGYSIADFYTLTLSQLISIKDVIERRKINELEVLAKLHGKEFKKPPEALNITREDRKEFDKQAEGLMERMKRRHLEEIKKNG